MIEYIPESYTNLRNFMNAFLPIFLCICTSATCLFGHKIHSIWKAFTYFMIGFFLPMFILELLFEPTGIIFWILAIICFAIAIICAVYLRKIHKAELFVTTFFTVYISLPAYIAFLGKGSSIITALIVAIIAAILSIKYKYLTVIVTTSFTGSFMFFSILESKLMISHTLVTVLALIFAFIGLAVQCYVEKDELKETVKKINEKKEKLKKLKSKD